MTGFWFYTTRKIDFFSNKEFKNFLIKNNVKTITICENFQKNKLAKVRNISKTLNIPLILVPSGLRLDEVKNLEMKKIDFCDYYLNPNKIQIDTNKTKKNMTIGSPRYHFEWLKTLEKIYKDNANLRQNDKLKIAAFVKSGSHFGEYDTFYELINKLKDIENVEIKIKNKPSDILPNKCTKFLEDGYSSSEIIKWSDIVITGRPSSVLAEAIIKDKYVFLINYNNDKIKECNFYNFDIIKKFYDESDIIEKIKILSKKDQKNNEDLRNKEIFLESFINFDSANNKTNIDYLNFYKNL